MLALGVAGCASQGVVGAVGSTAPSAPGSAAATTAPETPISDPSTSTSATADPSALASSLKSLSDLWTDPGCKIGLRGFGAYLTASEQSTAKGDAVIPTAITDLRAGASASKRLAATQAMTAMAKDLQDIAAADKAGTTADRGKLRRDWQIMGTACTG
ncbi:hypothetical protein ACFQ9X_07000 [Catenulispora yoronensis]